MIGLIRSARRARLTIAASTVTMVALLMSSMLAGPVAAAANVNVSCKPGALVQAVRDANHRSTATILHLSANCDYTFHRAHAFPRYGATALPVIKGNLAINGNQATITRANGAARFRLISVARSATVTLSDMYITNGRTRNGNSAAAGSGASGKNGQNGGAVYNLGTLTINYATISNNRAGDGGAGGSASGDNGGDGATPGANGEPGNGAVGGRGGNGGSGGAIFNSGSLTIVDSSFLYNSAGDGGPSGAATGGNGGNGADGPDGGNGGAAGGAITGNGGDGGVGGAIYSEGPLSISGSVIDYNTSGDGGDTGDAHGGNGGNGADARGNGGNAGGGIASGGGSGGNGSGIFQNGYAVDLDSSSVISNTAGDGGDANAYGGNGGDGGCSGFGGHSGDATATGGVGGVQGIFLADGAVLNNTGSTTSPNTNGTGGNSSATGGTEGADGPDCT